MHSRRNYAKSLYHTGVKIFQVLFVLVFTFSLLGVQPVKPVQAATYAWEAYNDVVFRTGQLESNITKYTISSEGTSSGLLVDYATGSNTPVTVAVTTSGTVNYSGSEPQYDGTESAEGTDAYNTFHGIVNPIGLIQWTANTPYLDLTFTGLDSSKTYTFATTANRAGGGSTYVSRETKFTISGVDSATNSSTSGVTTIDSSSVRFSTGENTANGYVARWTGINPGTDNSFSVRIQGYSSGTSYGPSVFMLAEEAPAGPTITTTGTLSTFTTPIGTPSAAQSYTVSGVNLTGDIVITPPTGFEISLAQGAGFSADPINLVPDVDTVGATLVWVRLSGTAGSFSGNITHTSTGATQKDVAVSGSAVTYYTLSVGSDGHGDVDLSPSGAYYPVGTNVTLTAAPYTGYAFSHWDGDLTGSDNPATITMDANKSVTANFEVSLCTTVNLVTTGDTRIRASSATTNYGAEVEVVQGTRNSYSQGGLYAWDLSGIPSGVLVDSASLSFYVTEATEHAFNLYSLRRNWGESTATWNSYNGTNNWTTAGAQDTSSDRYSTNLWDAVANTFTSTGEVTIDMNSAGVDVIQDWIDGSVDNYGLTIQGYNQSTTSDYWTVASKENISEYKPPTLNITYCLASTDPTITTTGTLTPFTTTPGVPSEEQIYTVSGLNLTGNLVITPPTGFQISTTSGSGFGSSVSLTPISGTVAATPIYVRLFNATVASFSGNITHTSTDATPKNVPVEGEVTNQVCYTDKEFISTADTYLSGPSANQDQNYGARDYMRVTLSTNNPRGSLLRFDLNSVPEDAVVTGADLRLNVSTASAYTYYLYGMRQAWVEGTGTGQETGDGATWNTYDGTNAWGAEGAASTTTDRFDVNLWDAGTTTFASTGIKTVPLNDAGLDLVQDWVVGGITNNGLTIQNYGASTTDRDLQLSTNNHATTANRPRLVLDYCVGAENSAPNAPLLVSPTDNATSVATSPTLSVTVSDPDGDPMDVEFWGRPVSGGTAAEDFTIIAIPDTQNLAQSYPTTMSNQFSWIANNIVNSQIAFVTGLGDIVNTSSVTSQWTAADTAYDHLDTAGVPYSVSPGNHDIAMGATSYSDYFGTARFTGKTWYQGDYESGNDNYNSYSFFSAGGMDFIVINLEYNAGAGPLGWADGLLKTHSDKRGIVVQHNLLNLDNSWQYQTTYNELSDNPNLFLMLCGHMHTASDGSAYRLENRTGMNPVHVLLTDYQDLVGGSYPDYLRLLTFKPSTDEIYAQVFSPAAPGGYLTSETNYEEFTMSYDMVGTAATPFDLIGTDIDVASWSDASISWTGLVGGTEYEWYAVASDGSQSASTESTPWSFTTAGPANVAPVLGSIGPKSVNELAQLSFTATATDADIPPQTLTYSLADGTGGAVPTDAVINSTTGAFTWTPTEAQGPGSYTFDVCVSDSALSDCETITVTVNEVNVAPILGTIGDQTAVKSVQLSFTATATDADLPANTLTYSLAAGTGGAIPTGAVINPTTGAFTWTPSTLDDFTFDVCVNDGTVSDCETITVTVNEAPPCTTVKLITTGDTRMRSSSASTNYGSEPTVTVSPYNSYPQGALFKWDLSSIPAGVEVDSASLSFYVTEASARQFSLYDLRREWGESTATYNSYDGTNNWTTAGAANATSDRYNINLWSDGFNTTGDVTKELNTEGLAVIQAWLDGSKPNYGLTVQNYSGSDQDYWIVASKENTSGYTKPTLNLTYCIASTDPTIFVNSTMTAFSAPVNEYSAEQSYTVTGANLTAGITVTAPSNFEVSLTSGSGFGSSVTLPSSGGTIYVRFKATTEGTTTANITHASTGAETKTLSVSGTAYNVYTLTVTNDGNGSVTLNPTGGSYTAGTTVTLTPVPNTGYVFDNWSGTNAGNIIDTDGVYTIVMNGNKSVTANFAVSLCSDLVFQEGLEGYAGTVDTYIMESEPTDPYGDEVHVEWDGQDPANSNPHLANYGLLRFDGIFGSGPNQIPLGSTIETATFTYVVSNTGDSATVNDAAVDWDESVTFNTFGSSVGVQEADYGTLVGTASGSTPTGAKTLDVKDSLQRWSEGATNYGWLFRPDGTDGVEFHSSEYTTSADRPKLTVRYCLAPTEPTILVSSSMTAFSTPIGTASAAQTYTVSGVNLTNDIDIGAPGGFEISTDGETYNSLLTLDQTDGSVSSTIIYVRMMGTDLGEFSGSIAHVSTPATTKNVPVTGTVYNLYTLTVDNDGNGTVTLDPDMVSYPTGTTVTLTPVPDQGFIFDEWTGTNGSDVVNTAGVFTIVMNENKSLTATFTEAPPWTAYNDVSGTSTPANTTEYTIDQIDGMLKDFDTGAETGVTVTITQSGTLQNNTTSGSATAVDTDAYTIFNGKVNMQGVVQYNYNNAVDFWMDLTFEGLDPDKTYTFVTTANRAGGTSGDPLYTTRNTRYTISDIVSATNASSDGTSLFEGNPYAVYFTTGENTANGYVARWINIKPSAEGTFTVRAQPNDTIVQTYAFGMFMLQEEVSVTPDIEITGFVAIDDVPAGEAGSALSLAEVQDLLPESALATTAASGTVSVPVSAWVDTDEYDPSVPGSYTFTATLGTIPDGYANTGNYTATIEVVVTEEGDIEITGFEAITAIQAGEAGSALSLAEVLAMLPTSAMATTASGTVSVPVASWVDTDSYDPDVPGSYTFTATLGTIPVGYANTGNYTATIEVVVSVPPEGFNIFLPLIFK